MVLGRHKHAGAIGDAGSLGLWTLNLDTPYWRPVRATGSPAWAGNFAATVVDAENCSLHGRGKALLVFGGEDAGESGQASRSRGIGPPLAQGGLWRLDLTARPSEILLRTLRRACRARSASLPEEALEVIISFTLGQLQDVAAATVPSMRGKKKRPMVSTVSDMLTSVIDKGITTDEVVDFVGTMVNLSLDLSYIASDATQDTRACRGNRDCPLPEELVDVTLGLLYALDAIIPGVVPSYEEATARRLKGGRGMGGKVPWQWTRRLQTSETRDAETMYRQFLQATAMTKQLTDEIHSQIYPGEAPISFALPGQDIFVGKAFIDADEETQNYAGVANLFDLPSLERGSFDNPYNYFNYRYVQFKKFPYDFLVMPGNRSLEAPVPANESRPEVQSLVPPQNISPSERLWHAISLIITDGAGESNLLERSIENVTYSMLPKIAAYDTSSFGNVENPSTCYWVDLGSGNFTEAAFDARGSIFSEDSCITMHTGNFIVLADDLAAQLDVVQQQSPGELLSQYEDDFTTTANVVSATLVLVACAGFVMVSVYVDEHDASNKVTPLDSLRTQVIDREDPKEKVLGTIFQAMRRNHLVIGWNYFHLKLTRVRRAGIFVVAIFATEALAVLQHSLLAFKADSAWGASGLVAAVLVFPLGHERLTSITCQP
ncbi:hypothetical protein AK812_SmicGene20611 [Symbiodinium microadriaticum]|uniref:Uncharacterized protein n=1 Tax=Symbiodinium microadriaticum TaxID=2951 RepID=A0A1Q9DPI1_SYMMI|nr:hypothetical protein AK812_SmicGene20611 [Symbiodinium microadriaticum]